MSITEGIQIDTRVMRITSSNPRSSSRLAVSKAVLRREVVFSLLGWSPNHTRIRDDGQQFRDRLSQSAVLILSQMKGTQQMFGGTWRCQCRSYWLSAHNVAPR